MSNDLLQNIYEKLPNIVQTAALNVYAYRVHKERYGKEFFKVYNDLLRTQYYSKEEIIKYQETELKKIIQHAYDTTSYYHELFDANSLKPADIQSRNDLYKIPVLTKDLIRENFDGLISSSFKKKELVHGHTSGTTGTPLDILWDQNTCIYTNAVDWRQKNWAGINYGDKLALVLGRVVVPPGKKTPPFWKMDYIHNQLWMSAFHLSSENIKHYLKKLRQYKPVAIEGYPSTVYLVAKFLNESGNTFPVKSVLTSSETLYPLQKEAIEKAFECKVFDFYGMAERVLFSTECDAHTDHHLNFEYGLTEIVDDNDNPLAEDEKGFIVSTSLQNYGMPLIRYKTSDVSAIKSQQCPCGRHMPMLEKITTKAEDIIVCPDGRLISPSILTHPFKPIENIEESQIVQEDINNITIKIVKKADFKNEDAEKLLDGLKYRLGDDMNINIEFVSKIERSASGKFRWVISKVVKDIYDFNNYTD
ncbi:MAG: hypothetical protein ABUK13_05550 [Gammaproteobacteria bacterium]